MSSEHEIWVLAHMLDKKATALYGTNDNPILNQVARLAGLIKLELEKGA